MEREIEIPDHFVDFNKMVVIDLVAREKSTTSCSLGMGGNGE